MPLPRTLSPTCIALIAGVGVFLSTLDAGIMTVALPTLSHVFHAPIDQVTWTITFYALALSLSILGFGLLADRVGALRIFRWGLCLFALSSVVCAMSVSLSMLLTGRPLQGVSAAMLQATAIALITTRLQGNERAQAMGTFSVFLGVGPLTGPVVGGLVLTALEWRWLFWLNIPLCALGLWGAYYLQRVHSAASTDAINQDSVSCMTLVKQFDFWAPTLVVIAFGGAVSVGLMLPPIYFAKVRLLMPWQVGLFCAAAPIGLVLGAKWAARRITKYGELRLILLGLVLMLVALLLFTQLNAYWPIGVSLSVLFAFGLGAGCCQSPAYLYITQQFPVHRQALAGSMIRTIQNISIALSTAVAGYVVVHGVFISKPGLVAGIQQAWWLMVGLVFVALLFMVRLWCNVRNF